jgi:hypothetical protein
VSVVVFGNRIQHIGSNCRLVFTSRVSRRHFVGDSAEALVARIFIGASVKLSDRVIPMITSVLFILICDMQSEIFLPFLEGRFFA